MGGHIARMTKLTNRYTISIRYPERKRPLGRHMRNWDDNIKTDLRDKRCELDSSGSGWCPESRFCEKCNETQGSIKGGEFLN
jgi:hypothetical protein